MWYLIKEGELIVRNLNYSDAGPYTCAARNILGSSEATGNLSVRGERSISFLRFVVQQAVKFCLFYRYDMSHVLAR